tara:strand:+ start:1258 stop:2496 length:1239 start_codon:yes stop_codon:yes gene_type:complete
MDSNFYKEFENNFRGSREQITQILSNYDGLIDYILDIDDDPTLLDIGSGRGEWMQKCNAKGFRSIGLELDTSMANDCRKLNLNIKQGDALLLLDDFPEDSYSIVSAFHVIEHMKHENINELLVKAKRILKPEGLLILETPCIDNFLVSTKSFHIDPTHINPIHPDLLAFITKRIGFKKLKYYFINSGPLHNAEFDTLTRVLNGVAQDLVLIASKSNFVDNSIFHSSKLIKRDMRLGITALDAAVDFDNYSRNRYSNYDEAIFLLRKRIIDLESQSQNLEKHLQHFVSLYQNSLSYILINKMMQVKIKIVNFIIRLKNIFKSLFRYSINSRLCVSLIKRIYKIQDVFFILRYIENKLDDRGYRIYNFKFVRKSKKIKEDLQKVSISDQNLENYFYKSEEAKNILKDLNKHYKS